MGANDDLEGSEEELEVAGREWKRMEERSLKEGFREGRSTAEEEALQEGFDQGYTEGFTWAKQVGRLRGRLAAKRVKYKDSDSEIGLQLKNWQRKWKNWSLETM